MQGFMKVILVIVALLVGSVALIALKESRGGVGPGPFGVVIAMALFAGIKAIWSYKSEKPEEKNTNDVEKLDKN
jgi:hypothetical protein